MPWRPSAPLSGHSPTGNRSVLSISAASGAIFSSEKSRTLLRSMSISGPRSWSSIRSRVFCIGPIWHKRRLWREAAWGSAHRDQGLGTAPQRVRDRPHAAQRPVRPQFVNQQSECIGAPVSGGKCAAADHADPPPLGADMPHDPAGLAAWHYFGGAALGRAVWIGALDPVIPADVLGRGQTGPCRRQQEGQDKRPHRDLLALRPCVFDKQVLANRAKRAAVLNPLILVRSRRLELPRSFPHSDLNAARLPIPPRPHAGGLKRAGCA